MQISQDCVDLVKKFEGFRANKYTCLAGYRTIGYGHKMNNLEKYDTISEQQAEELLYKDLKIAASCVYRNINYMLNQHQFDALTSFTFNVGGSAFQRSTLRQKINYAELDKIEHEMLKWIYVGAVKIKGLIIRRTAEIELFYRC